MIFKLVIRQLARELVLACASTKMEGNGSFCPHCGEFVAPRTYRRHKRDYYNEETGSWDVGERYSSDEESSAKEYDKYDELSPEYADEAEDVDDEEYMEVYLERVRGGMEFWEDAIEDVLIDFDEDNLEAGRSPSLSVDAEVEVRTETYAKQLSFVKWICLFLMFWTAQFQISDNALETMLQFFNILFTVCQRYAPWFGGVVLLMPTSVYLLRKTLGIGCDRFTKYVVCPNCHSLYPFSDCFYTLGSRRIPKRCCHRPFPNHRQMRFRATCGEMNGGYLLKEVQLKDGTTKLYPHKVYSYMSVLDTLKAFMTREDFWLKCNLWKMGRDTASELLTDVFDGRVWREFLFVGGEPFLAGNRSLGLMLNVDWFQPFKLSRYSVGVIYLVVMNLPRNERFKFENVILVGVIPGPHEPSISINTYLAPLVDELLVLWEGWHVGDEIVRGVLLCVASDLPAARKVFIRLIRSLLLSGKIHTFRVSFCSGDRAK